MRYLLFLILLPVSVFSADFLDDFAGIRSQVKSKLGISVTDSVLLPDTILNQFIREGIASQVDFDASHVLVDTFQTTLRQNEYILDSLALTLLSVRWQGRDSIKILRYMAESLWTEQKHQTLPGQLGFDLRPSFYDYFRDTSGTIHLLLYPPPAKPTPDTSFYVRFIAKPVNLASTSSLSSLSLKQRLIVLDYVTTMAAMHLRLLPPSEQVKRLSISGFGGLNTVTSDFGVKPNEARVAHNIDFSEEIGSLALRKGYDSISAMSGMDSLVGIFGVYNSDGTQNLLVVADSDGVGYGNVYIGAEGSADISSASRIWQYFSIQNKPSFAMLDDNTYIVNGSQKGIVWNGKNARPYPFQAPGEPLIVPLTSSGPLHGEYRYMIRGTVYPDYGRIYSNSVVSSPVIVKNGQILFTRFQFSPTDSIIASIDSMEIFVYRTKANPGPLDLSDTAYSIGAKWILKGSNIGNLTFIDSISDDSLSSISKYPLVRPGIRHGRDSLKNVGRYYGSPTFVSSDTTHPDGDTLLDMFEGWPTPQADTLGVAYVCTFIDTATGIESDTGRSLFVFCDSGNHSPSYRQLTIGFPKTIDTEDGIIVNLYRAGIMQLGHDTTWLDTGWTAIKEGNRYIRLEKGTDEWKYDFIPDTVVVVDYYLVGQFTSDDTLFTDSISFDSLSLGRRYRKQTAPPLMSKIFSYENRLFGIQKSGLYYSANVYADTLQSWGAMALTPINPDDGDMVTTAWPARGVIRVMKSYSNVNVYQDANLNWNKTEISGYFGCIAGRSHVAGLGGHYYLSSEGVLREVEGMALERTQQVSLLSKTLNNFDQQSVIDLSEAEGFYFDRKYLLNLGDTTYVYDERAETWSTWGFEFSSATLYSTEDEVRFLPGDSMYFIKPGSSGLYRFGGSDTDKGSLIPFVWQSVPWAITPEIKRVTTCDLWVDSDDSNSTLDVVIYNEADQQVASIAYDDLTQFHTSKGIANNSFLFGYLRLEPESGSSVANTVVHAVDLEYIILGKKPIE